MKFKYETGLIWNVNGEQVEWHQNENWCEFEWQKRFWISYKFKEHYCWIKEGTFSVGINVSRTASKEQEPTLLQVTEPYNLFQQRIVIQKEAHLGTYREGGQWEREAFEINTTRSSREACSEESNGRCLVMNGM